MSVLTCSFWQQDLCARLSRLPGIPSPGKFANTCQAGVLARVLPVGHRVGHTKCYYDIRPTVILNSTSMQPTVVLLFLLSGYSSLGGSIHLLIMNIGKE